MTMTIYRTQLLFVVIYIHATIYFIMVKLRVRLTVRGAKYSYLTLLVVIS